MGDLAWTVHCHGAAAAVDFINPGLRHAPDDAGIQDFNRRLIAFNPLCASASCIAIKAGAAISGSRKRRRRGIATAMTAVIA